MGGCSGDSAKIEWRGLWRAPISYSKQTKDKSEAQAPPLTSITQKLKINPNIESGQKNGTKTYNFTKNTIIKHTWWRWTNFVLLLLGMEQIRSGFGEIEQSCCVFGGDGCTFGGRTESFWPHHSPVFLSPHSVVWRIRVLGKLLRGLEEKTWQWCSEKAVKLAGRQFFGVIWVYNCLTYLRLK